ncbi:hypothetical protein PJKIFABJ_00171 [Pseudomonas phage PE09]|uniref:Uncharacterized protein n=2 Tax=Otagovirus TaxID=2560197 RepID=A0A7S8BCA0_9CAUD|nr:hypothetical protein QGX22_gp083 [Pseudomonas phage PE09]YP_010768458.1 hypothetical protein QGX23_gp081 [Pseudomonas phage PN09]QHZ60107.1 hypothetical protein PJKIFABJ_00171 [Pseudomonas phage PE09]QPB10571.1 hypothetical protein PN09_150 [Pseudomonas phage PN09]
MTTDDKILYIQSFMRLVSRAETYRDAAAHSNFTRGIISAWHADLTLPSTMYKQLLDDLEIIMAVKRNLPMQGDVV